tara:strand:- start:1959 stop:2780 length:822 start_codon:yes stop_codon:yes gene_type:complete
MNIGIVGQGFVGNAIYQKFKNYYKVKTYDIVEDKCNSSKVITMSQDVVFICLPTPMDKNGRCDTSLVEKAVKDIFTNFSCKIVVIKSTVTPGTTSKINSLYPDMDIVFNPEFLTEANAVEDFNKQNRIILGGPRRSTTKLKTLYRKIFPDIDIIKTGSTHAEMVKYLTNTFLATKISFANEIFQICEGLKLDYDKVIEYATLDKRLGKSHWAVPGPDGDFGFGGHCFPKDLQAILNLSEDLDTTNNVLCATQETNNNLRKNRDWENMKGRAIL